MSDPILDNLNPQQYEAVTAPDGPLLIIAGAGSGKTRVITRRIAYLVRERSLRPYEIFAVTFTNKAAGEMKRRVAELTGDAEAHDFHIATFHSLCARILRREAVDLGISRSFAICDEHDQLAAVKHVIKQLKLEKQLKPADALYVISQCKMRMLGPEHIALVTQSKFEDQYADIFRAYDAYLHESSALDFEDLILSVIRLFKERPNTLEFYQHRYKQVLVDEYQDTNAAQFELVRLLASEHRNLTVVGDEDQSIYSWRGADISNLLDFQKHFPDARLIRLEQNYRSTGNILRAADAVIAHNTERLGKHLFTEKGPGAPVFFWNARTEALESHAVVEAIQEFARRGGYSYSDVAIFYRMGALSRVLEDRLRQMRIPYRVVGGIRFYERAEIKDLLSYLSVVDNPDNSISLYRIINTPKRGIGPKSLQAITDFARREKITDYEAMTLAASKGIVPGAAAHKLERFVKDLAHWRTLSQKSRASEVLRKILDDTEYIAALGDPESFEVQARTENIQELQNSIVQYEEENPMMDLQGYLETISLMSSADESKSSEPSVSLMTLHSAKGLEFKLVFIVGLEEGIFPSMRAVMEDNRLEEERRLFYVGITRSREILVLTRATTRMLYGEPRMNAPSRFWKELPKDCVAPLSFPEEDYADPEDRRVSQPEPEPQRQQAWQEPPGRYQLGVRVRHRLLGEGTVIGLSGAGRGAQVLVKIDDGQTYKLMAEYANLEVID